MKVKSESEVAQSCPTLSNPWTAASQAPSSMGFSRQEYWSWVPLASPTMWAVTPILCNTVNLLITPVSGCSCLLLFSHSVVSDSLWLYALQHTWAPCPSLSPRVCSNSCPLSWWCYPTISSSVTLFCSYPQSFPMTGSYLISRLFASGGQSIGASASSSILPIAKISSSKAQPGQLLDWENGFQFATKVSL